MTVLRGCVGCRTVAVPATATARDLKERIFAETGFPVAEQRLWRGDREVGGLPGLPPPLPGDGRSRTQAAGNSPAPVCHGRLMLRSMIH